MQHALSENNGFMATSALGHTQVWLHDAKMQ